MSNSTALIFFSPDDWLTIAFRLGIALIVGGVVGINRQQPGRPAGVRTYMTVSLGAAMFVMLPLQASIDPNSSNALSRTVQGVATGVGFIGAGIILQQSKRNNKPQVKGLTSAAALWLTAALGTAAGCGLWQTSLIGTLMTLVILSGVKKIKKQAPVYKLTLKKIPRRTTINLASNKENISDSSAQADDFNDHNRPQN